MSNLRAVLFYPSGCDPALKATLVRLLDQRHYDVIDWQRDFKAAELKSIIEKVWASVRSADLIVAVLNNPGSAVNPNVLYEYGFSQGHCDTRRACRVLTILCQLRRPDGSLALPDLPFDIGSMLHLVWKGEEAEEFEQRFLKEVQDRAVEIVRRQERLLQDVHAEVPWLRKEWMTTHQGVLAEARSQAQGQAPHQEAVLQATASLTAFVGRLRDVQRSSDEEAAGDGSTSGPDRAGEMQVLASFADEAHRGGMEEGRIPHEAGEWHALGKHMAERTAALPALGLRLAQVLHVRRVPRLTGRLLLAGALRGALWAMLFAALFSVLVAKVRADQANRHNHDSGYDLDDKQGANALPSSANRPPPAGTSPQPDPAGRPKCCRQVAWSCLPRELGNAVLMLAAVVVIVFAGVLWRRNLANYRLAALLALGAGLLGFYFAKSGDSADLAGLVRILRLSALALLGCWLIESAPLPTRLDDAGASRIAVRWGLMAALGTALISGALLGFEDVDLGKVEARQEVFEAAVRPWIVGLLALKHACTAGLVIHGSVRRLLLPWLWA